MVVLDVLADEEPQVAFSKHDHAAAVRMRNCSGWDIGEAYASAPGAKNTCSQGLSTRRLSFCTKRRSRIPFPSGNSSGIV